eukprot:TRINITY_DN4719_c0_g1_i1.p1 TRINITY_DN4719_c0_g1~~TRINITY_DN4719_c0_g1_i1.p1  ORF type:complete len:1090 (+),score=168.16 TRINITY_DN4719_c0_g1_i1:24-3293(+)
MRAKRVAPLDDESLVNRDSETSVVAQPEPAVPPIPSVSETVPRNRRDSIRKKKRPTFLSDNPTPAAASSPVPRNWSQSVIAGCQPEDQMSNSSSQQQGTVLQSNAATTAPSVSAVGSSSTPSVSMYTDDQPELLTPIFHAHASKRPGRQRPGAKATFMANETFRGIQNRLEGDREAFAPIAAAKVLNWAQQFLRTKWGAAWEAFQMILAAFGVVLYIYGTYTEKAQSAGLVLSTSELMEVVLSCLFAIDILLNFWAAPSRLRYLTMFHTWVDIVSVLPVLALLLEDSLHSLSILRVIRVVRVFRILRTYRLMYVTKSGTVSRELALLFYTVLALLLCAASIYMIIEPNTFPDFHTSVYWVVVTIATVGYGDFYPTTALGRMCLCLFILGTIILLPTRVNRFVDLYRLRSSYAGTYRSRGPNQHVIVTGDFDTPGLRRFLKEFFNTAHGFVGLHVVVLGPAVDRDMRFLLESKVATVRCTYVEGSAMDFSDLVRARLDHAKACFVLNRMVAEPEVEDAETLLRTLSIRSCSRSINPRIPIYITCQLFSSKRALYDVGATIVFCLEELRGHILATSCSVRGFDTLLSNLLTSHRPWSTPPAGKWLSEYTAGAAIEIYPCYPGPLLTGRSFIAACDYVFREYQGVVIGVRNDKTGVLLNPGNSYIIDANDVLYVLSENNEQAQINDTRIPHWAVQTAEGRLQLILLKQHGELPFEAADEIRNFPIEGEAEVNVNVRRRNVFSSAEEEDYHPEPEGLEACELDFPQLLTSEIRFNTNLSIRQTPRPVSSVQIQQLPSFIRDHVVVLIDEISYHFVLPLRCSDLNDQRVIVFVVPEQPPREQLVMLTHFDDVYVVVGNSSDTDLFHRCRLSSSGTVIVNAGKREHVEGAATVDNKAMIDFKVLMTTLRIQTAYSGVNTISVLTNAENARFISRHGAGPFTGEDEDAKDYAKASYCLPSYAEGSIFNERVFENLLCLAFFTPDILEIVEALMCTPRFQMNKQRQGCKVFLIDNPPAFDRKSWHHLFTCLIKREIVPIGIYRWTSADPLTAGLPSCTPSYVYTAPSPDLVLSIRDQIYVLAKTEPSPGEFDDLGYR